MPGVALGERNPPDTTGTRAMRRLDLRHEDPADQELFNRVLWALVKGPHRPYPGTHPDAGRHTSHAHATLSLR